MDITQELLDRWYECASLNGAPAAYLEALRDMADYFDLAPPDRENEDA